MRTTLLLLAVALVACDAKDADANAKKTVAAPAPADAPAGKPALEAATPTAKPIDPTAMPTDPVAAVPSTPTAAATGPVLEHQVKLLDGTDKSLADYRGKALLVVNTASECGFTPQYADLQELYVEYADRGFEVLAFPSNDFGAQEPGTPEQIREFVDKQYSVEFQMFDKVAITGEDKAPLYKTLTEETPDGIKGEVKWNFTKFLVDPQGRVVQRFESGVSPKDARILAAIEQVLPKA